jgi:hypothetical protein
LENSKRAEEAPKKRRVSSAARRRSYASGLGSFCGFVHIFVLKFDYTDKSVIKPIIDYVLAL